MVRFSLCTLVQHSLIPTKTQKHPAPFVQAFSVIFHRHQPHLTHLRSLLRSSWRWRKVSLSFRSWAMSLPNSFHSASNSARSLSAYGKRSRLMLVLYCHSLTIMYTYVCALHRICCCDQRISWRDVLLAAGHRSMDGANFVMKTVLKARTAGVVLLPQNDTRGWAHQPRIHVSSAPARLR